MRKVLRSEATECRYRRDHQPMRRIGPCQDELDRLLAVNEAKPNRERLTLTRIFEELRGLGYEGGYDAVRRYARGWQRDRATTSVDTFVPLSFAPGEAYQFDWSHEIVLTNGTTVTVRVAHVRLCHSRMLFVRAHPRETQEMVFDAHDRAFACFRGACTRGIYDNMRTAVDAVFVGRERAYESPAADVQPPPGRRAGCLHPRFGLGEGTGREPGRAGARAVFHAAAAGEELRRTECLAARPVRRACQGACAIPRSGSGRSGRCSRPSGPALFPTPGGSTGSTRCPPRCPRPASCGSTTTNTRSPQTPSAGLSKSGPMPSGSSCAKPGASSVSIGVASGGTRRCLIPGTMCRFWPASRGRCATGRRSRTGFCRPDWSRNPPQARRVR